MCVHLLHYHFPVLHLLHHHFPTTMCLDAAIIHVGNFCLLSRVDDISSNATHLNSSFVFLTSPFCLAFFCSFLHCRVSFPSVFLSNCVVLPCSSFSLLVLIYSLMSSVSRTCSVCLPYVRSSCLPHCVFCSSCCLTYCFICLIASSAPYIFCSSAGFARYGFLPSLSSAQKLLV